MFGDSRRAGKDILRALRESTDSCLRPLREFTSSAEARGGAVPRARWSFGLDWANFGALTSAVLTNSHLTSFYTHHSSYATSSKLNEA